MCSVCRLVLSAAAFAYTKARAWTLKSYIQRTEKCTYFSFHFVPVSQHHHHQHGSNRNDTRGREQLPLRVLYCWLRVCMCTIPWHAVSVGYYLNNLLTSCHRRHRSRAGCACFSRSTPTWRTCWEHPTTHTHTPICAEVEEGFVPLSFMNAYEWLDWCWRSACSL